MKWSDLPNWLKVLIVILVIVTLAYLIKLAVDYFKSHKQEIYKKLLAIGLEIEQLVSEKKRILKALIKAKLYTRFTISLVKIVLLFGFFWFTNFLIYKYRLDIFSALASSAGTIVIAYNVIACLFNFKIRGLNELKELASLALEDLYRKRLSADPAQIIIIDSKIKILKQEVETLKASLNP